MGSERFFQNEYEDVTKYDEFVKVMGDGIEIVDGIKAELKSALLNILEDIEQASDSFDKHDISVYTGSTGISLLYLQLYKVFHEEKYLESALIFVKSSLKHLKGRRITFLCGDAGPLALGAVVYHLAQRKEESAHCIKKLISMADSIVSTSEEVCDELLYGRSGYVYSLLFANKNIPDFPVPQKTIDRVIESIFESGIQGASKMGSAPALMYTWHSKAYVGAAHGLSGIFHTLLMTEIESPEQRDLIKSSVDFVLGLQFPSGNFPSSLGSKDDKLLHWCHGAPGCVYLMLKAFSVFGDQEYLDSAKQASDAVWKRGLLKKGYGLCHGAAGNGYGFIAMYNLTKNPKYLFRAIQFGLWCSGYNKRVGLKTPDRPFSLFEGIAGAAYFIADLLNFSQAKFPAFEL